MRIWILRDSELLPIDGKNIRLLRAGLIANELYKRGHEVVWWTSSFNHFKKEFRVGNDKEIRIKPNYLIKQLHGPGYQKNISFKRIFHNRSIAKKFLQLARKEKPPDIILAAMPTIELAYAAIQYGKSYNVPVIVDLRDMWPDIMVEIMPAILKPFARLALNWQFEMVRKVCRDATGLIGITSKFLQWGLDYAKRKRHKFDFVSPLAYTNKLLKDRSVKAAELYWKKYDLYNNEKYFIISFIGTINKSFQLKKIIEVAKKTDNNIKFVIVGLGSELKKYQQHTKQKNIIFPGWLNRAEIFYLLKNSSIGIAPYIRRKDFLASISNKIAEYLSIGLPIVTTLPEASELGKKILNNKCGFCYDENDIDSLIKIINKLKNNKQLLKTMSKNARALYEREFVAEKVYGDMCDHLEKIAKKV